MLVCNPVLCHFSDEKKVWGNAGFFNRKSLQIPQLENSSFIGCFHCLGCTQVEKSVGCPERSKENEEGGVEMS